jgi:hypothetical protein
VRRKELKKKKEEKKEEEGGGHWLESALQDADDLQTPLKSQK